VLDDKVPKEGFLDLLTWELNFNVAMRQAMIIRAMMTAIQGLYLDLRTK
jgi:hypothetical protein